MRRSTRSRLVGQPQDIGCAHASDPFSRSAQRARRARERHLLRACSTSTSSSSARRSTIRSRTSSSLSSSPGVEEPDKDISLYIVGGRVHGRGLAIYDTMNFVKPDIKTMCIGVATSMGSLLLTAGAKGKRSLPSGRVLSISVGRLRGPVDGHRDPHERDPQDAQADGRDLRAAHRPEQEQVRLDMERDRFFKPEEAVAYGLDRPRAPAARARPAVVQRRRTSRAGARASARDRADRRPPAR